MYVNIRANSKIIVLFLVMIIAAGVYLNTTNNQSEVVIYTSVDQVYSEPVLDKFEEETGIKVKAVYDVETAMTTSSGPITSGITRCAPLAVRKPN